MRAGIGNTILGVIMRQMHALRIAEKGELQNPRGKKAASAAEFVHLRTYVTEILGNNGIVREQIRKCRKECIPGALLPGPLACARACGDRIIGMIPAKVIKPQGIKAPREKGDTLPKKAISVRLHGAVVIQRISPNLPVGREIIGRYARNACGAPFSIQ